MSKLLFSIIIPTLNEEKWLPFLLQDLTNQKEKNFEVIVADGKSEDNTQKLAREFKDKLNIQIVTCPKRNLCCQRNVGAQKAKGEYLLFFDADVSIDNMILRNMKKHIDEDKFLVYMPIYKFEKESYHKAFSANMAVFFSEVSRIIGKPFTVCSSLLIQRDFFNFVGGYDEEIFVFEDHEIVQRAFQSGVTAKLMKDVIISYSYRRFEREGYFHIYRRYTLATIYMLRNGKVDKELFNYEMGGSAPYLLPKKKKPPVGFEKKLSLYFKQFKNLLEE